MVTISAPGCPSQLRILMSQPRLTLPRAENVPRGPQGSLNHRHRSAEVRADLEALKPCFVRSFGRS